MSKILDFKKFTFVSTDKNFRFDISFLRIIAVFAVVFYHYNIFPFRSGFVGVDIFFVISGYLMTRIILLSFENNSFTLLEFYKRRIVRIFPALLVLLLLFSAIVFVFVPIQLFQYLRSAYSSSLFFSNILYYLNDGYFNASAHNNFLLHTWSLSVEWQFYMVYPILLLFLRKIYHFNIKLFTFIFCILIVISFLSMIYHSTKDVNYSFYIFYTRAWEMLCGGLAFLYYSNITIIKRQIKIVLAVICYLILGCCIVLFGSQSWPSSVTIIPVIATTLILGLNVDFAFFKNSLSKYLGDVSYSFYLYHWPIYVLSMFFGLNYSIQSRISFILISLICAVLSFEFVEKKAFFKNVKLSLIACTLIFAVTLFLNKMNASIYSKKFGNLMSVSYDYVKKEGKKQYNIGTRHFTGNKPFRNFNLSFLKVADNGKKNVVLLGDSHAGMFAQTFENLDRKNINLIQITSDATYPMLNSKSELKESVNYFNYAFSSFFKLNKNKIDLVVIASNYAVYTKEELEKKINFTNNYFDKLNIKYSYLGQTQTYPIEYPTYIYMKTRYNIDFPLENKIFEKNTEINEYLKLKLDKKYIDILNYKIKNLSQNYYPYIYDNNHLTLYGTEQYRNVIFQNIDHILYPH
ncbi:acyltransferase family protein [Flavobacterium sp. 245]|uniref:acyltransferase family protein n=1 Tax=Flavobacterium sp. 245 TaxID=2512115 RepID=UPI00105BC442|nr:acyltransferase family protein [Flavobacterium sp. 245]TDP00913.1 peptidoglycan/LPS O-acetylase OafA/YrhL [Flavobacterium sp. 245]